jgi:hypothetical protein
VPSAFATGVHAPVAALQVPAVWQASAASQTTALPPAQAPARQLSPRVQALPSSHVVPSGAGGLEHSPVAGLHAPAAWHESAAVQRTGPAPVQTPAWQESVRVQALPSLQLVPSGAGGLEQAPVAVLQVPAAWH